MRFATYNIEWFNSLFDDDNQILIGTDRSGRHGVSQRNQVQAIASVLAAMDADAVMIIEAPDQGRNRDTVVALERFAATFDLRTSRAVMGFANHTQQEIALLFDPDAMTVQHDPVGTLEDSAAPRFDGTFRIDLDIDATRDVVRFSKPPLELSVKTAGGRKLRLIGAHLKSKAPHGAKTRDAIMRQSIANRRKQLAQAIWLRARIQGHLDAGDPLILMGDLNDGPGLDEYEHLFGRSSVEIVMGDPGAATALYDPHAQRALQRKLGANPTTARFFIEPENRFLQALLDYIMVSPDFMSHAPHWRIWHPFDDPHCWNTPDLREALLMASDHFPVTLDLTL